MGGLRHIPLSVQHATLPLWAGLFYALLPKARHVVEANLDRIAGPLPPIERAQRSYRLFLNYAQAVSNLYLLHIGRDVDVEAEFVERQRLVDAYSRGQGAIVVTGHMGYWQIAPFLMAKKAMPPMTMAMAEEPNAKLAQFEDRLRESFRIVYTTRSPFATLDLAQVLRRGELVGMQLDRHLGGPHIMVDFFGSPAPFPLGPAQLARATGAPLVPVFMLAGDHRRKCNFYIEEPIFVARTTDRRADLAEATTRLVAIYERYVRTHPEQWFNFHDFWQ
jgi:Kdo2-lipid IVA lauroyltransferase/acyltransferase